MKLGKVAMVVGYIVDLDNPKQVKLAKELIAEDFRTIVADGNPIDEYFEVIPDDGSLCPDQVGDDFWEVDEEKIDPFTESELILGKEFEDEERRTHPEDF